MDAGLIERLAVSAHKTRVHDFLRDFDKLGLKRIHPDQAIRALTACGMIMTSAEQTAVKEAYTGEDGLFQYERFEEDINDVPLNGFFERNPDVDPASTNPFAKYGLSGTVAATASALMPRAVLPPKDAEDLERILSQAQYESHSRGIVLAQYIRQYDHSHRGVVTKSQFLREFMNYFRTVTLQEAELITRAYSTADGQVMYMAACKDITPEVFHSHREDNAKLAVNNYEVTQLPSSHKHLESGKRSASPNAKLTRTVLAASGCIQGVLGAGTGASGSSSPSGGGRVNPLPQGDAQEVLEKVIRFVFERRINITNIFTDFDKMHRHRITRPQFVRAVASLGLTVALPSLEVLAAAYVDEADSSGNIVIYRRFLDDVNSAFCLTGLEKDPLRSNDTLARSIVSGPAPRLNRPELTKEEDTLLQVTLADIQGRITRVRAFNVGAGLRDFDVLGEGHITLERFMRVLAMYALVPELQAERNVLVKYYKGSGSRSSMINYRIFMEDMQLA